MTPPRIIAGQFKGLRLQPVPGTVTRPITDRVKEALFNIIGSDITGSFFLDLFGGTGSVGIEALSRGAEFVTFIEKDFSAFKTLTHNLAKMDQPDTFEALRGDAFKIVERGLRNAYDYIFIAPPQYKGMWKEMLQRIDMKTDLGAKNAWIIVQIDPIEYEEVPLVNLKEFDNRDYGSTRLVFYINS